MSYKVDTIAPFHKEAKKLTKKYPSLKGELAELGKRLSDDPIIGTPRLARYEAKRVPDIKPFFSILSENFYQAKYIGFDAIGIVSIPI